jgi:hypothetical protein
VWAAHADLMVILLWVEMMAEMGALGALKVVKRR